MLVDNRDLIKIAIESTEKVRVLTTNRKELQWTGYVGAALITEKGNIFTGINLSLLCGIGFCAEHSAIAEMIKHGETKIKKIVATTANGKVLPPCGRCRELIYQVDQDNINAEVIIDDNRMMRLGELLPENWQQYFDQPLT